MNSPPKQNLRKTNFFNKECFNMAYQIEKTVELEQSSLSFSLNLEWFYPIPF